jgi:superfamily I DNA/RNA helicase
MDKYLKNKEIKQNEIKQNEIKQNDIKQNEIKQNDIKQNEIKYNKEQLEFIHYPLEDCKLLGIPGGGKTQSIIGKIIYHYKESDFKQNNNFLILTFSRRACNDFIEKGKRENKKYFTIKNIRTIHSLAGKIVHKIINKKSSSQDTVIISSIDIMSNNLYKDNILNIDELLNLKCNKYKRG